MLHKAVALFVSVFCFLGGSRAVATTIPIDLGPSGITNFVFANFANLNGTPVSGQPLSLDFTFNSNQFIRLYTATQGFTVSLDLVLGNVSPSSTAYSGTAYLVDNFGNALTAPQVLSLAPGTDPNGFLTIAGFSFSPSLTGTPLDFYGIHFDLTLPTTVSTVITSSSHIAFSNSDQYFGFGVGPGSIPADVVPDAGHSVTMLALAMAGLFSTTRFITPARVRTRR